MNLLRLEAIIDGIQTTVERPFPDMRGYHGQMSIRSGIDGTLNDLGWELARKLAAGTEAPMVESKDLHQKMSEVREEHVNTPGCMCPLCNHLNWVETY